MNPYDVTIIQSMESFRSYSEQWEDLLSSSHAESIFLTHDWLYTWSECFLSKNRQLFIIVVKKKNRLIGIAPWYLNQLKYGPIKMKQIQFLGSPEAGSDYLDVISLKGEEKRISFLIYEFLFQRGLLYWDSFSFQEVPSNSVFFQCFLKYFECHGKHVELKNGSCCPVLKLPSNIPIFMESLSSNRRQQFKRHLKLLQEKHDMILNTGMKTENISFLKEFKVLYKKNHSDSNDEFFYFLERYIKKTENEEIIHFDSMKAKDKVIACIIHLNYNSTKYMYSIAINKEFDKKISIGNVLLGISIQKAIEDKFETYDFLKGDEDFKFHWTGALNKSIDIHYYKNKIGPVSLYLSRNMKYLYKVLFR